MDEKAGDVLDVAPVVVGGAEIREGRAVKEVIDKSQLKEGVVCGKFSLASAEDLEKQLR